MERDKFQGFILLAFGLFVATSCNKPDDNGNNNSNTTATNAYLKLKANGVAWEATQKINTWGAQRILLAGKSEGEYPLVSANIPYNGSTGTFDMTAENSSFFNYQDATGKLYHITASRGHGSITVNNRNTVNGQVLLSGTFEGTAYTIDGKDSVIITGGEFYDDMLE